MAEHSDSEHSGTRSATTGVPLSERPLVADDQNTVISTPEVRRGESPVESAVTTESILQRLFPPGGVPTGEESGIRLAHFEIRERLGSGGMGAVFRATDLELARDVALKIMHPASAGDPSLVARFRNEARACAHLNHDNIARVYFAGSQEGIYFIAYELADGSTIKDLIEHHRQLQPAETVNYAIQVTLALNHIAAAGIVHRDIKPSNIMLTESGRVKVVDLGLARRDVTDSIGDITVAGTTLGTFDYIAPEQAREPRNADIRSDIYSLGCTMYHMLTGQPPYPEGTALQKLLDHQGKSAPDPRSINASISPELAAVLRKMMANDPAHRYQAPALLLSDLLHIARLMGLQSIPAEGIVWRKLEGAFQRQPLGAVWVFSSVLAICVTALVLNQFPRGGQASVNAPLPEFIGTETEPAAFTEEKPLTPVRAELLPVTSDTPSVATAVPPTTPNALTAKPPIGNPETVIATPSGPAVPTLLSFSVPVFPGNLFYAGLPELPLSPLSPTPAAETAAAAEQEGPFILQRAEENQKRRSFSTLQGAIADARSGDVILLRYNGHPAELPVQPPVRVVGINLIIRAAEGFRPTLEFESETVGVVSRAEMITVRNRGSLTVRDLDLRVRMTSDVSADRWSLFRLDGPNRVQLENVTLDCQNAEHQSASVFDLSDEASSPDDIETSETSISLDRVVCRGDVDGFRISSQPQGRIRIRNSAFAVSGTLLTNLGSTSMLQTRGDLELWMEHSSFVLGNSLIVMKDSDELTGRGPQRTLPALRVNSDACVFASAVTQGRLVVSEGNSYVEEFEALLTWNGFTNLYFQYSTLWHLETAALDYTSRRMDSATWREFWRNRSDSEESNAVELVSGDWMSPLWSSGPPIPFTTFQPNLIQLNASSFVPTSGRLPLARDGLISGVDVGELPDFPVRVPLPEIDPLPAPISAGAGANRSSQTSALSGSLTVPPAETSRPSDSPLP